MKNHASGSYQIKPITEFLLKFDDTESKDWRGPYKFGKPTKAIHGIIYMCKRKFISSSFCKVSDSIVLHHYIGFMS